MKRLCIAALSLVSLAPNVRAASEWNPSYSPTYAAKVHAALVSPLMLDVVCSGGVVGMCGGAGGLSASSSNTFTAAQTFNDDIRLIFGTGSDAAIEYNTTQTVDNWFFGVGQDGRGLVIAEQADRAFDFAHAQQTNPTLFVHSANQNTSQWISMTHDGTNGLINAGTGVIVAVPQTFTLVSGSSPALALSSSNLQFRAASNVGYTWTSTSNALGTVDTSMWRDAAAVVEMGVDVNGAAVAQTFKAHDGIIGTDIAGANLTLAGGRGTGAGTASDLILQTGTALGTGTTAQTLVTRQHIEGGLKTLTDATATTVFTVTTGNDLSCGGTMFFTVEAADAANQQTTSGSVNFAAADNAAGAGGENCAAAVTGTNAAAATSGTLTVTADATTGTDLCNIRLTATGSLTETVGPRVRYSIVFNPTSSSCAVTPQ